MNKIFFEGKQIEGVQELRAAGSCGRRSKMAPALSFSAKTDPHT